MKKVNHIPEITLAMRQRWNADAAIECLEDAAREVAIVKDRIRKEQREEWRPLLDRWLFAAERQTELAYYEYLLSTALLEDIIDYERSGKQTQAG